MYAINAETEQYIFQYLHQNYYFKFSQR